jgi:hypothetical protein
MERIGLRGLPFCLLLATTVSACGAYQDFDHTRVIVYPRYLELPMDGSRYVREKWGDNLYVTYDPTATRDLREKRYVVTIGKRVFDRYDRNELKAVQDTSERVVAERKLCATGWSLISTPHGDGSSGLTWTIMCKGPK